MGYLGFPALRIVRWVGFPCFHTDDILKFFCIKVGSKLFHLHNCKAGLSTDHLQTNNLQPSFHFLLFLHYRL